MKVLDATFALIVHNAMNVMENGANFEFTSLQIEKDITSHRSSTGHSHGVAMTDGERTNETEPKRKVDHVMFVLGCCVKPVTLQDS